MTTSHFISRQVIRDNPEVISQHIDAKFPISAGKLFDYLTTSEHLAKWFGTVRIDEFTYDIEDNASGRIESCKDNSFLVTWEYEGTVSYLNVEVTQASEEESLFNAGFSEPVSDSSTDFAEKYGPGASGIGWDLSLWGLQRYISGVITKPAPEEYAAFITESAQAWGEADIVSGTAPETARNRAENSRLFYVGEEE